MGLVYEDIIRVKTINLKKDKRFLNLVKRGGLDSKKGARQIGP